ncbi:beta-sandwich domain-containing protein [Bdellovibrio sp. NC01]|uniref:beta-sandwich domain-containing protein n=1 Tax=Bdellovibrio sp. NC01 TaxID=2220073 RepID=UPI00115BBED6|nr:beta-sandwich domain-containing protein [Bdellovibrio sp. NC01]QDK37239.1 hypothetical protein DOE51_06360 [Bdellovibrio sp. NC01]
MRRHWMQGILSSAVLVAGVAHAQAPITYQEYGYTPLAAADAQPAFEGIGKITDVTRKTGGALYQLDLSKPLPLSSLKAKAKLGKAKILSVNLVTDKSERIPVKALTNVVLADADANPVVSENISVQSNIVAIEIQAEAMGGSANIDIIAVSSKEIPQLALHEEFSCSKKFDALLKEKLDVVQTWAARAEQSAPGSWQEKYASKEFSKYVADFVTTLKADKSAVASTDYTLTLLNFFTERQNASRADSAADIGYKTMATETFEVFLASFQAEQTCRVVTSDALITIALDFQKRQEANKPDSRARKMYEMMITKIGKLIPNQYRKELATKNLSFRQADNEGYKNYKLFNTSKPESFLKPTYQEMSSNAYALAEQALAREVKALDNEQTYQLIVEYQAKYNDAANYPQDVMMRYLTVLSEHSYFLNSQQK